MGRDGFSAFKLGVDEWVCAAGSGDVTFRGGFWNTNPMVKRAKVILTLCSYWIILVDVTGCVCEKRSKKTTYTTKENKKSHEVFPQNQWCVSLDVFPDVFVWYQFYIFGAHGNPAWGWPPSSWPPWPRNRNELITMGWKKDENDGLSPLHVDSVIGLPNHFPNE